jgi:prepilin peptidase CpaA
MTPLPDLARWAVIFLYCVILLAAAAGDLRHRLIPNWTALAIALLFIGWIFVGKNVSVVSSLEAALIMFAVSVALYAFRVIGAGDSKLVTAVALFTGMAQLPLFLLVMSAAGGAMAVGSLASRPTRALIMFQMRGKGDFGRGIPYGIAIALGGIFVVLQPIFWPLSTMVL